MTDSLYGLVLAGGESRRMQRDKALMEYHGRPQLAWTYELLAPLCTDTWVSVRAGQHDAVRDALPRIDDSGPAIGPAGGLLAAHAKHAGAWLVLACDLPLLSAEVLGALCAARDTSCDATAYRSSHDGLPEPLCAVWEATGLAKLAQQVERGVYCPRKALMGAKTRLLDAPDAAALDNINTPDERAAVLSGLETR